jgi:isoleucyl-tRNA synthetase
VSEHPQERGLFAPFPSGERAPEREARVLAFWDERDVFRKSMRIDDTDAENFVFFEGPPTANALPGVHHAAARIVKDLFCRYQTMKGRRVLRKGGWDTHGLPVELEVEKALGLKSKGEVETFGIAEFNKKCRERVMTFAGEWTRLSRRIGFWTDMDDPYMTFTNDYVESVWWILKRFFETRAGGERVLFEGHKVVPYCPRCETSLSSHEVSQGYQDVQDPSVFVRFRERGGGGRSFLVWTTTPWTLVSNAALAVHPDVAYVRVAAGGEEMWVAEARAPHAIAGEWTVVEKRSGRDLVGLRYEPLFPYADAGEAGYRVVAADFVSIEEGTGIVHMAPAFGEDDALVGRREGLPTLQPVDASGRFTAAVAPWAGRFVKDADPEIIKDLKARGLLYKRETVVHSYPHCWRCESPLLYFAKKSWFVRTTAYQDRLIEQNSAIDWHPPDIGRGRFGEWLKGNIDWNLSRDRYWGTPLPIWRCAACGADADVCVGSLDELRRLSGKALEGLDLHRPFVDEVAIPCARCKAPMRRVAAVIDAWFDSGAMPFAQWHYPFENADLVDGGGQFPADFISEGLDQTRGWFYSLLAISTLLTGDSSYKRCVVIGLVLDEQGKKMSKSKGNVVDPWQVVDAEGADALRWYLLWTSPPWISKRFSLEGVAEAGRKYLGTLENLYNFFALYAGIDGYDPRVHRARTEDLTEMDRWIRSRLEEVTYQVDKTLAEYDVTLAARGLQAFVIEDLSNWYVRRSRGRFWTDGVERDKVAAFETLHMCLARVARLTAPLTPFLAEALYERLVARLDTAAPESVHLALFPQFDAKARNGDLEGRMDLARGIVALGRAARNESNIKIRQPLARAWVALPPGRAAWVGPSRDVILDELNLKSIEVVGENALTGRLRTGLRLRFDKFGPRLGKKAKAFAAALSALPEEGLRDYAAGRLATLDVEGEPVALQGDEAEVKREATAPHEVYVEEGEIGLLLDKTITEDLRDEGFVREVINKVQYMRKEAGFQVTDRIRIGIATPSTRLRDAIGRLRGHLERETLAIEVGFGGAQGECSRSWDINGEAAEIGIARATSAPSAGRGRVS